jgi:hypothetical protein
LLVFLGHPRRTDLSLAGFAVVVGYLRKIATDQGYQARAALVVDAPSARPYPHGDAAFEGSAPKSRLPLDGEFSLISVTESRCVSMSQRYQPLRHSCDTHLLSRGRM